MGTAALTTRGMKKDEMVKIGEVIATVLKSKGDKEVLEKAKETTKAICNEFRYFKNHLNCIKEESWNFKVVLTLSVLSWWDLKFSYSRSRIDR